MTLPDERYRSIKYTRDFLFELMDPKQTPRVPKDIRRRAASLLKHYPGDYYMDQVADQMPGLFAKEMEPVTRLFQKYEQGKKEKNET